MYIEFTLPTGAGGSVAQHAYACIAKDLLVWSNKYNIQYTKKIVKYTVRVILPSAEDYTMFGLTWDDTASNTYSSHRWRFVEPMDPPKPIDKTF